MTEIKVQCDCGQKYKFEVEPINGQMPYAVACPICGLDGTKKANAILREPPPIVPAAPPIPVIVPSPSIPGSAPTPIKISMGAGAPVSEAATAVATEPSAPAAEAARPRLRINTPVAPEKPEPAVAVAAPEPPRPRPVAGIARPAATKKTDSSGRKPSFALGLLGGFSGALIGGIFYYVIFHSTGFRLGLMAIGVGFLAGLGARLLGKEGSTELGVITATLTIAAVFGAQYFVARQLWNEFRNIGANVAAKIYAESVKESHEVMTAVPTGSDQEIRIYLANREAGESGSGTNVSAVTPEQIKDFRENELPIYRDLASGKVTKEAYMERFKAKAKPSEADNEEEEKTFKTFFMLVILSRVGLFSLAAGAGLAYKMSTDAPG